MSKIAFATSKKLHDLYHEDRLVVPYLEEQGHTVIPAIWNDSSIDWNSFDLVVIRSPWDYFEHSDAYSAWLKECQANNVKLLNPAHIILDNIDKRYLLEFEKQGVTIVPTEAIEENSDIALNEILSQREWDQVVIKPIISAGSYDTWRSSLETVDKDETEFTKQKQKHKLFVQPFLPEIVEDGEYSVLYFNGEYSHSVVKRPKQGDYRIQEQFGGIYEAVELSDDILDQTQKVIDVIPETLLYARVDGVIRDGKFLLMELEINEPSLYFGIVEESVKRFADAICEHL